MELTADVRAVITAGRLAHLVTINPDGSPQVSVVWVGLDGDDVVMGHLPGGAKVRNIARDPRVAITIEAEGANAIGMIHYLVLYGTATLEEGGAAELLQRLAPAYVGPGVKFPPMDDPPPGHVIRVHVERVGGMGPWAK